MKYVNESERKTEFIREYRAGITEAYRGFTPPQYNMLIISHFIYSIYNIPCHKVKVCKFIKNRNI